VSLQEILIQDGKFRVIGKDGSSGIGTGKVERDEVTNFLYRPFSIVQGRKGSDLFNYCERS
jgi:hypothetical protein